MKPNTKGKYLLTENFGMAPYEADSVISFGSTDRRRFYKQEVPNKDK